MSATETTAHKWRFFRAGGFDQVRLDSADDLVHLGELDQKLWVALSCPTKGLELDSKTLEAMDEDKDGRIRVPEILAATKWATTLLKKPGDLLRGARELRLDAINDKVDEGKQLLAAAKQILVNLGKSSQDHITVEDTSDTKLIFAKTRFNGDGIVPVESAEDEPTRTVIADIISVLGSAVDRSDQPGIDIARVELFWKDAEEYLAWWKKSDESPEILAFGADTAEAMALVRTLRPKIEDYFTRCRLVGFDERSVGGLNRSPEDFIAMGKGELSLTSPEVTSLPLARIEAGRALPLGAKANPAFIEPLAKLRRLVVKPLVGDKDSLSDADWQLVLARFDRWDAWQQEKVGAAVEPLGLPRIREILASDARARLDALIVQDKALEPEANAIAAVDKLVRLHRDLYRLLNNYVSFHDFYTRTDKAIFQAGTLYFDQRSCEMCMRVEDAGRHATFANLSRAFLVYCDVTRRASGETMQIVAAVTDGDAGDLAVGRNGIFYDREGRDWDATISKIVDNPISIRQAFWSPYRKVAAMVEEQLSKFAAARDKEVETSAGSHVESAAKDAVAGPPAPAPAPPAAPPAAAAPAAAPAAFDVAKFAGIFAAIGLAIGAIGGVLGTLFGAFIGLPLWEVPLALAGIMLLISGPAMLMAWIKLRQRNLGPLLDANGWAINTRARINIAFGASLTSLAKLPPGSVRDLRDPFADKNPWKRRLILLGILAGLLGATWYAGVFNAYLPWLPKSGHVLRKEKAAEDKAAADKAAADKAAAAEKAAAEKAAADKAAAEKVKADKAAADKAAADKLAADKAAADKAATAPSK